MSISAFLEKPYRYVGAHVPTVWRGCSEIPWVFCWGSLNRKRDPKEMLQQRGDQTHFKHGRTVKVLGSNMGVKEQVMTGYSKPLDGWEYG